MAMSTTMATKATNGTITGEDIGRIPPSQSLYIQNLSIKEKKEHIRRLLYITFTSEAQVIDVNVLKSPRMQGQAHILFKDIQGATYAMERLQGSMFLERPLRIAYSKNRSKTLDKMLGVHTASTLEQFRATPGSLTVNTVLLPPPSGLPQPSGNVKQPPPTGFPTPPGAVSGPLNSFRLPTAPNAPAVAAPVNTHSHAIKRKHEGSDDEAVQEEEADDDDDDDDDDAAMEMSSDEGG